MFLAGRPNEQKEYYKQHLRSLGSLSRLFSDSNKPYLYYRAAENLFCKSFGAKNHSRSDIAIDASFESIGVGLKTFINSPSTKLEKVAEFNSSSAALRKMGPEVQVLEIARLRNERLETSKTIYDLNSLIYHCVTRDKGRMAFIESPMNLIDLDSLSITSVNDKAIKFKDNNDEYSFNLSKSTLFKRFSVTEVIDSIDVQILDDPFKLLESLLVSKTTADLVFAKHAEEKNYIVLPLYSTRIDKNGQKQVQEKSALNQWNASGRARDFGEVYIHIPAWIHTQFKNFFPERDEAFTLELPNMNTLQAKICQDGNKALMSNPNKDLGQWLLRDVLKLAEGELLTYKKLEDIGLDSVVIYKSSHDQYKIDFAKIGTFERFANQYAHVDE